MERQRSAQQGSRGGGADQADGLDELIVGDALTDLDEGLVCVDALLAVATWKPYRET